MSNTDSSSDIHCSLCDDNAPITENSMTAHVLHNHLEQPKKIRKEYPNTYEKISEALKDEVISYSKLIEESKRNPDKIAELIGKLSDDSSSSFSEESDDGDTDLEVDPETDDPDDGYEEHTQRNEAVNDLQKKKEGDGDSNLSESSNDVNTDLHDESGIDDTSDDLDDVTETIVQDMNRHGSTSQKNTQTTDDQPNKSSENTPTGVEEESGKRNAESKIMSDNNDSDTQSNTSENNFNLESKWFFIGVGGCGGNLVDSALLRKKSLLGTNVAALWEQGLQDAVVLNTNRGELGQTYFATEYTEGTPDRTAGDYAIGKGGGGTDPFNAREKLQNILDEHGDKLLRGYYSKLEDVEQSEGVMVLHSAVKGTGSGTSGLLTKAMKEQRLDDSAVFHFVVLPDPKEVEGSLDAQLNGLYGVLDAAKHGDAIILVDNKHLNACDVNVPISDYQSWANGHQSENETAMAFLEGFTISSTIPKTTDDRFSSGDMFDIADAMQPALTFYADDDDVAPILAPALSSTHGSVTSRDQLKKLVNTTLTEGRLVDFDPATAWGGAFLFYGPDEKIADLKRLAEEEFDSILQEISFDFQFTGMNPGPSHKYYVGVEGMEEIRLWAIMWNPKMESLRKTSQLIEEWGHLNMNVIEGLQEREEDMEELFGHLGYDYLKSDGDD